MLLYLPAHNACLGVPPLVPNKEGAKPRSQRDKVSSAPTPHSILSNSIPSRCITKKGESRLKPKPDMKGYHSQPSHAKCRALHPMQMPFCMYTLAHVVRRQTSSSTPSSSMFQPCIRNTGRRRSRLGKKSRIGMPSTSC